MDSLTDREQRTAGERRASQFCISNFVLLRGETGSCALTLGLQTKQQ